MQRNHTPDHAPTRRPARLRHLALFALLALVVGGLGACTGLEDDLGGATIESLTIDPDTIPLSDTGMSDEYFTATLNVSGFTEPIDPEATTVFVEANGEEIEAVPQDIQISGNTIILDQIQTGWVGSLEPGTYQVGATVQTELTEGSRFPAERVTERGLATITIVP